MTQIMTPLQTTTAGQIDKAVANYRALLEKHSGEFNIEAVQTVLDQSELAGEQLSVFRRRVEAASNLIVRRVKVNRTRTPQETLIATGRKQYVNDRVVATMSRGEGDEVELYFFKPDALAYDRNGWISDADLEKQFELRGLKPADPYSLAVVNEADPVFADEHPNATHWKDAGDHWCFAAFNRRSVGREVFVNRRDGKWSGGWSFAGLRK